MKKTLSLIPLLAFLTIIYSGCNNSAKEKAEETDSIQVYFPEPGSYEEFIKNFPRKKSKIVHDWQGNVIKKNSLGVLDIDVTELQQCADAAIRLRAEYFYSRKEYDKIEFKLTSGLNVPFSKWADGFRVKVNGNKATLVKQVGEENNFSRENFKKYLETIMMYAGSVSLDGELVQVIYDYKDRPNDSYLHRIARIGDMLIIPGFPGHVVIIVDEFIHNGIHYYQFAQSWILAQEIEIVEGVNPMLENYKGYTPIRWKDELIQVSGYDFIIASHLKTWQNRN